MRCANAETTSGLLSRGSHARSPAPGVCIHKMSCLPLLSPGFLSSRQKKTRVHKKAECSITDLANLLARGGDGRGTGCDCQQHVGHRLLLSRLPGKCSLLRVLWGGGGDGAVKPRRSIWHGKGRRGHCRNGSVATRPGDEGAHSCRHGWCGWHLRPHYCRHYFD